MYLFAFSAIKVEWYKVLYILYHIGCDLGIPDFAYAAARHPRYRQFGPLFDCKTTLDAWLAHDTAVQTLCPICRSQRERPAQVRQNSLLEEPGEK